MRLFCGGSCHGVRVLRLEGVRFGGYLQYNLLSLTQLVELDLHGLTFFGTMLTALRDNCPNIRILRLNNSPSVRPTRADWLSMDIATVGSIEVLELQEFDLSNWGVLFICRGCVRLRVLDLRRCFYVTADDDRWPVVIRSIPTVLFP